jgi:DNA end-binding protein Ku
MLDLAKHIIKTKTGHFEPEEFEDRYESALKEYEKKIRVKNRARRGIQAR